VTVAVVTTTFSEPLTTPTGRPWAQVRLPERINAPYRFSCDLSASDCFLLVFSFVPTNTPTSLMLTNFAQAREFSNTFAAVNYLIR
jgi:hypothetical protein